MNMKQFLKPTKVTWGSFVVLLIIVNTILPEVLYNSFSWINDVRVYHFFGLQEVIRHLGFDVGSGCISSILSSCMPDIMDWVLTITNTLFTFSLYYLLASYISKVYYQRKNNKIK